jgi:hypothetical protein
MRRGAVPVRTGLAMLAALAMLPVAAAGAAPLPPEDLEVVGGADSWHSVDNFCLRWENPPPQGGQPVAAVHYRVRNAEGAAVVGPTRIDWPAEAICEIQLANIPGIYDAEVWLEDAAGSQGAPAAAKLRFDNVRPDDVAPLPVSGWIARTGFPHTIRIEHSGVEPPLSGIRGYAVSIDSAPNGNPCAAKARCTDAETDLHGGAGDDALPVAGLPEGTSYVHVVAVSGSGMKSSTAGHAVLHVDTTDPVTVLTGAPSGWASGPVTLTATATDGGSGMNGGAGGGPFTAIQVDGGTPSIGAGAFVSTTVIAAGVHRIAYYARDSAGNVNDGSTANGIENEPPALTVVRIDREAPAMAFANSQVPGDPELIRVRLGDSLSGPDPSRGWIGVRRAGSGDRFEPLPSEAVRMALPAGEGLQARWDSDAYAPGEYEFWAIGYDRAGNAATTTKRSDGSRMVLPNPVKTPTTLLARFVSREQARPRCLRRSAPQRCRRAQAGQRRGHRLVAFGRGALFSGRLIAGVNTPLQGMAVRIVERFATGSRALERASTVRTDARGAFAIRLRPGPSRQVTAIFGGTQALARSATPPVELGVRSSVRLRASSGVATVGGRPIVFRGGVTASDDATSPARKSVQLQFRVSGGPWSEFRTVQTDRRGRFRLAYRFSDDDSRGVRFQFRAFVPEQRDWPYEPAGSRPIMVRGR